MREADEQTSLHLIEALVRAWSRIRSLHPEVPAVMILAAPASREQLNVLGHFAALRWRRRKAETEQLHEVVVIAEYLDRPPEQIFETLLHEAAHALNFHRGIKDCTASQYHNRSFAEAAVELGLKVERVKHYGYALTCLAEGTAARYAPEIEHLASVLVHRARPMTITITGGGGSTGGGGGSASEDDEEEDTKTRSRSRKATCACPYIIRVSKKTIEETKIRCEKCGEVFSLV